MKLYMLDTNICSYIIRNKPAASHALSLKAILVTNNIKEFERVNALELENWV